MYLPRRYVEKHWLPSIGEKLDKIHYREPPPGTGHAELDPNTEYCEVHYDKVNPHQDPLGHLIEDSPETLVALGTGALVYAARKNVGEAILASIASYAVLKLIKSLFYEKCQS